MVYFGGCICINRMGSWNAFYKKKIIFSEITFCTQDLTMNLNFKNPCSFYKNLLSVCNLCELKMTEKAQYKTLGI